MPEFNRTPNSFFAWLFTHNSDQLTETKLSFCRQKIVEAFNKMLEGALPPRAWRDAEIVCLHKGGDREDPGNYRPIALLAALNKLWTSVLTHRLTRFVEDNNIHSESQRGGRPDMSTYQPISTLLSVMAVAKKEQKPLWILFLDLKKAYNSVPFWAIRQTLQDMKIPEQFTNAIMNMYDNLRSKINLQGVYSEWFHEERGVRQGDTLSPLLWILFLNPLLLFWKYSKIGFSHSTDHAFQLGNKVKARATDVSFVDDMAVFVTNGKMLKSATGIATNFFNFYGLEIGIKESEKTAIMDVVGESPPCEIQGKTIPKTSHYKYLGLPVSANLSQDQAFSLCKTQLQNAAKLLSFGPRFSIDQIVFLANQVLWPIVQYRTRTIQFTKQECEALNKIVRSAVRKTLHQYDYPNAMIHGDRKHILGGLGIIDIAVQQRVDFLTATLNLTLNKKNPGQEWLRLLFHMSAKNTDNLGARLPLNKPHCIRMLGNLAVNSSRPSSKTLEGFPQLQALYTSLEDTNTNLISVFDCFPDETKKLHDALESDKDSQPNFVYQDNGRFATLKLKAEFIKKVQIPAPMENLTNQIQNSWSRGDELNIFTFNHFNEKKPDQAHYTVSLGIADFTQIVFCYKDERINSKGVTLQAIERALLLVPQKVGNRRIKNVKIWASHDVSDLFNMTRKQLKNQWHRNVIKRIQHLVNELLKRNQSVTFPMFESNRIESPTEEFPRKSVVNSIDWLPFAFKAMLNKKHIGEFEHQDMTPVLFSEPFILVKRMNFLENKPKLEARGIAMRTAILNQIRLCEMNATLKSRVSNTHKNAVKTQQELNLRAKEISPPKSDQIHLIGEKHLGTSKSDNHHFRKEARNFLTLRSNRQDTNARLMTRKPPKPPVPALDWDMRQWVVTQQQPSPFDQSKAQEFAIQKEIITKYDKKAIELEKKNILNSVNQIPKQADRIRELSKRLKKFESDMKLWNRYKYVVTSRCNRCHHSKETTAHVFRDCPSSKTFLLQMVNEISQPIKMILPEFTWQSLWQDADGQIGTYGGEIETAYWLLLGYRPARLDSMIAKTKNMINLPSIIISAIRKAKQSILELKKQADMYVYFTHRWNRLQQEHPEDFEAEHIADEVQCPEIEEEALFLGDGIDARNWVSANEGAAGAGAADTKSCTIPQAHWREELEGPRG
jgi:hypothetical protein